MGCLSHPFASSETPVAGGQLGNLHHRARAGLGIMDEGDSGSKSLVSRLEYLIGLGRGKETKGCHAKLSCLLEVSNGATSRPHKTLNGGRKPMWGPSALHRGCLFCISYWSQD